MNMLKLIQRSECPPDQYRTTFKEDGHTVRCFSYDGWLARIANHRRYNGYETPPDWIAMAEDELCKLLPPGFCVHDDGTPPAWFVDTRAGIDDITNGTKVLATFIFSGMPTVPIEQVESRADTCAKCYFNVPIPGCSTCHQLANVIADMAGEITTKADPYLKACAVCKCANQAQTRLPIEILKKGVTPDMMEKWPEFCWKGKELRALDVAT